MLICSRASVFWSGLALPVPDPQQADQPQSETLVGAVGRCSGCSGNEPRRKLLKSYYVLGVGRVEIEISYKSCGSATVYEYHK